MKALLLWLGLCAGTALCIPLLDITVAQAMNRSFFQGVALLAAYFLGFR